MGWFTDVPLSEHDLSNVRLMKAGAPSEWKKTRHKILLVIGLVIGFYLGIQFADWTGAHAAARPCPSVTAQPSTTRR